MSKPSPETITCCAKAPGRPKAAEVEARMHDLVETAGALFVKHGYTKVSLEAIAREAHVAVRTIYVKFGGKAGLLNAVIQSRRDRYFKVQDMETDPRPFKIIVEDFARHFLGLLWTPEAMSMQRVVIAESARNPELAQAFNEAGPQHTRAMLDRFFARPDIRAQLRDDLPFDQLPMYLLNTIAGDQLMRLMFPQQPPQDMQRQLDARLQLFYRSVLRDAA
jgi:TetR/AcrR family transcriptional repressor of mexJK operon